MRLDPPDSGDLPGVYVHVPFCAVKCTYCDFPVAAGQDHRIERYLEALLRELDEHAPDLGSVVDTIYLGGGTPSRLSAERIGRVLDGVRGAFDVAEDRELTIESNPEDLTERHIERLGAFGVDRLSIGLQSLDDDVLRRCLRSYDAEEGLKAVRRAAVSGFRSVNVDLILGLPGERLSRWTDTVDRVVDAGPGHVSVYLLETDGPTVLAKAIAKGEVAPHDEGALADAYAATIERLTSAGLVQYEISNFARSGHRSRHNEKYWTDAWYAGVGVGAHTYVRGCRSSNARGLTRYLRAVEAGRRPTEQREGWNAVRRLEEALFLGLRRTEGVHLERLGARYGIDLNRAFEVVWRRHSESGLLVVSGGTIRLTDLGRIRSNEVFRDVIGHLAVGAGEAEVAKG